MKTLIYTLKLSTVKLLPEIRVRDMIFFPKNQFFVDSVNPLGANPLEAWAIQLLSFTEDLNSLYDDWRLAEEHVFDFTES